MNVTREKNTVFYGPSLLALVTSSGLFVMSDTRKRLSGDAIPVFDAILLAEGANGLTYVDNLKDFTDAGKAFRRFIETGEKSPFYTVTAADEAARTAFIEMRDRFKAGFTVPELPRPDGLEHFLALGLSEAHAETAMRWTNGEAAGSVRHIGANVLRFEKTGGTDENPTGRIVSSRGDMVKKSSAEPLFKAAMKFWYGSGSSTYRIEAREGRRSWERTQSVRIKNDCIEIGCQTIPRAEVERIGKVMGWSA